MYNSLTAGQIKMVWSLFLAKIASEYMIQKLFLIQLRFLYKNTSNNSFFSSLIYTVLSQ